MISRKEIVIKVKEQMGDHKKSKGYSSWHYGYVELRELLDYIYGEEPTIEEEKLNQEE